MSQGLCPSCGATVSLTVGLAEVKCQYCESIVEAQQAETQFAQFSETRKHEYGGALLIAETARKAGNFKKALKFYNKAIEQKPTDAEVWLNMATCLVGIQEEVVEQEEYQFADFLRSWKEAIAAWETVIICASNPDAMKKRVATEINNVFTALFRQYEESTWDARDCYILPDDESLFQLMESAIDLSLNCNPRNAIAARNGILLCKYVFLKTVSLKCFPLGYENELYKAACEAETKYAKLLEEEDSALLKECKSLKAGVELLKAEAQRKAARAEEEARAAEIAKKKKAGCFVATACYGNYDHPIVKELRQFRDTRLEASSAGRAFVQWYYKWSPAFANLVAKSKIFKAIVRVLIVIPAVSVARLIKKQNSESN